MLRTIKRFAASCLIMSCSAYGQVRHALVIGNDSYPGNALENARNDATAVFSQLKSAGYDATLVLDSTRNALSGHVDHFVDQLHPGDTAMLYYAGHGMQINGENYLVPVDFQLTSQASASDQAYSLSSVLERFTSHGATTQIVILDACRDNPFLASRSERGGWAGLGTSAGAFIAFGTSPGSTASDAPNQGHGLFTKSLLQYMTSSDRDIEEMFRQVREDVIRNSGGKQVPWVSSSLIGSFHVRPELDVTDRLLPNAGDHSIELSEVYGRSLGSRKAAFRETVMDPSLATQLAEAGSLARATDYDAAINLLQSALIAHPSSVILLRVLGLVLHTAGRDPEALDTLNRAIRADPSDTKAASYRCALEGVMNAAAAEEDCVANVRVQPSADSYMTLAGVEHAEGDDDRAVVHADQALALGSNDLTYALRGSISADRGLGGLAKRDYAHAAALAVQRNSQ